MTYLPDGVDINKLLDDLRISSWTACDILLNYSQIIINEQYNSNFIKVKNNNEPVTLADLEVHNLFINSFQNKYSDIDWKILSEETINNESINEKKNNWIWILDPLDGTKDFIQGTNHFSVHFALNYKKKPLIGVVLIPSKNELWISNGENVWCENRERFIKNTNLTNIKNLNNMTIVTSKNHRNESLKDLIQKINFKKSIAMGSIGCKIASILRGEADLYLSLSFPGQSAPKDWDFAAPEVILRDAGGAITNIDNEDLSYLGANFRQEGLIIASNNRNNHENICLEIKKIIKENNLYEIIN